VSAEHHDNATGLAFGGDDGVDDAQEIPRDEHIGQRFQECRKASVLSRRRREFGGSDFVGTALDRNGSHPGKVSLRRTRTDRLLPFAGYAGVGAGRRLGLSVTAYGFGDGT
jgi:hypothetical protein